MRLMRLCGANDAHPPRFQGRALVGTTKRTDEPVYGTMANHDVAYHIARRGSVGWTLFETNEESFNFFGPVDHVLRYGV